MRIFFFAVLCITQSCITGWSQRLSGIACKTGKVFSCGFPVGMGVYVSTRMSHGLYTMEKDARDTPPIPPVIEKRCREILSTCDNNAAQQVTLRTMDVGGSVAITVGDTIYLDEYMVEEMEKAHMRTDTAGNVSNSIEYPQDEEIAILPFTLRHEYGHKYFGDTQLSTWLTSLWGGVAASQLGASIINRLRKQKPLPTTLGRASAALLGGIAAGSAKWYSSNSLQLGLKRYQESRADTFACKHTTSIAELEAAEGFMRNQAQHILSGLIPGQKNEKMPMWKKKLYLELFSCAVGTGHPNPITRAEKIRTAIEQRKQKTTP